MKTKASDRFNRWFGAAPVALGGRGAELNLPPGWPEQNPTVRWWNRAEETNGQVENVTQLPASVRALPVHVWTPAADTLLTNANIPSRSRARILQALPYALEDQLLDEPETLHFAYVREANGSLAVAVTRKARLNAWLETLKGANLRPASLCPANLALPLFPQAWSMAFADTELWVRSGPYSGFATWVATDPPPLLIAALKEAMERNHAPQRLVVFSAPAGLDPDAWSAALDLPVIVDTRDFRDLPTSPALNLLQADFGQTAHLRQMLRPLRPAMIMLAIWLGATLALDTTQWLQLRHTHNTYVAEMRRIYRQSFGTDSNYPYEQMKKQMENLQSRGGAADLLPLLTRVAPTLKEQGDQVKLHSLKYSESGLTLELTLPNYQALDTVKNAFQAAKLDVEVLAANSRDGQVDGRLRVRASGAGVESRQKT